LLRTDQNPRETDDIRARKLGRGSQRTRRTLAMMLVAIEKRAFSAFGA
jgi:hypothetical protein